MFEKFEKLDSNLFVVIIFININTQYKIVFTKLNKISERRQILLLLPKATPLNVILATCHEMTDRYTDFCILFEDGFLILI